MLWRKKWFGILTLGQQFIGLSRILASLCHAEIVLKSTTHSHSKSHAFDPFESEPKHLFSVRTLLKATWKPVALKSFGKGPSLINKFLQNKRWGQTTTEWVISSFKIYLTYYIFTPLFLLMPFFVIPYALHRVLLILLQKDLGAVHYCLTQRML